MEEGGKGISEGSASRNEQEKRSKNWSSTRTIAIIIIAIASLAGLYYLSQLNYLLFHVFVEIFGAVTAIAIFAIAWSTRRLVDNSYFKIIGVALLFVAILALFHTLAYKGMGVFPTSGANLATQLWIATRYLLGFSFLFPLLLIHRKVKSSVLVAGYSIVTALTLFLIYFGLFPQAYNDITQQLTTFKVASEFAISAIILLSIVVLIKKRKEFSAHIFKMLLIAMALAIVSEMAFTVYTDVYGIANMAGHLLSIVSFYFIYVALIETSLTNPFELLFRNLKQSEISLANRAQELTSVNDRLEQEIAERKAIEEALRESEERLQLKLDSVLSPDVEMEEQDLANIIDVPSLQATMNHLYGVTKMGFALKDLKGNVLISTGWQEICIKFHRVDSQSLEQCIESDVEFSGSLKKGEISIYKCKNNMREVVTPLYIGDKHVGNVFFGQFFFEKEKIDRDLFAAQAEKYGFNKEAYLAALERVPRFSKEKIERLMVFYAQLTEIISKLSHSNLKLAKSLYSQKELQAKLEDKAVEVEEYASQMEKLAEERARQLKDAERLSAIGATAGMVGHDIRNPLQAITSELYLEKLEVDSLPDGEAKQNLLESIHSIEENILYMDKIVADLQDFAKPLNPKKEKVQAKKAIADALAMVSVPDNIKVTVMAKEQTQLTVDSTMMRRILVNLIQNGVQAMPKGGELTINVTNKQNQITIDVQDTGNGIPKEVQEKIFTPLMTTKAKGQGFGLAVVKRMTEAMGGKITFESEAGVGTKFTLNFQK